jgi:hypothetical protein
VDVLVSNFRQDDKPLLKEFGPEPIIGTGVCKVYHQLEWFAAKWLKCKDDVVDEQVSVGLAYLVAPSDVIKNWIAGLRCSRLIKYVEGFYGFELVLFVHIMLGHNFFKFRRRHVHATPSETNICQLSVKNSQIHFKNLLLGINGLVLRRTQISK